MKLNQKLRLIFVRHGETTGKSSIRFYGKTDVPLNDEGIEQMKLAGYLMGNEDFNFVFTSNLSRTIEGAKIILGQRNNYINIIDDFREIDFGRWEGLTLEEINQRDPELYLEWRKSFWTFNYPEGEKRRDFFKRVKNGMDKVMTIVNNGNVLLVLHKGIIRTCIEYLVKESIKFNAPLGSIHEIEKSDGKWNIVRLDYSGDP